MKLEILARSQNKLIEREEITFKLSFEKATPSRAEVRKELAKAIGKDEKLIIIVKLAGSGRSAIGSAHVYETEAEMRREKKHLLVREGKITKEERGKKETEKSEEK